MRDSDLPVFQHPMHGPVEDLMKSEESFRPFAAQVRKDVKAVLRDYDIEEGTNRKLQSDCVAGFGGRGAGIQAAQ